MYSTVAMQSHKNKYFDPSWAPQLFTKWSSFWYNSNQTKMTVVREGRGNMETMASASGERFWLIVPSRRSPDMPPRGASTGVRTSKHTVGDSWHEVQTRLVTVKKMGGVRRTPPSAFSCNWTSIMRPLVLVLPSSLGWFSIGRCSRGGLLGPSDRERNGRCQSKKYKNWKGFNWNMTSNDWCNLNAIVIYLAKIKLPEYEIISKYTT